MILSIYIRKRLKIYLANRFSNLCLQPLGCQTTTVCRSLSGVWRHLFVQFFFFRLWSKTVCRSRDYSLWMTNKVCGFFSFLPPVYKHKLLSVTLSSLRSVGCRSLSVNPSASKCQAALPERVWLTGRFVIAACGPAAWDALTDCLTTGQDEARGNLSTPSRPPHHHHRRRQRRRHRQRPTLHHLIPP